MSHLYLVPNWFFIYSLLFEVVFAVAAGLVSYFSFKVYSVSKQREIKLFGIGFMFISASYLIWLLMNLSLLKYFTSSILILELDTLVLISAFEVYAHMTLFIVGLLTIVYATFKTDNKRAYSLLIILTMVSVLASCNKAVAFYLVASILLLYIIMHYLYNYLNDKNSKVLMVLIAFCLLFLSHAHFIFATNAIYYVLGHVFELMAYFLISIRLILLRK